MSTFSITSINGKRCTAVPRTAPSALPSSVQVTTAAPQRATAAPPALESTTSIPPPEPPEPPASQTTTSAATLSSTIPAVVPVPVANTGGIESTIAVSEATSQAAPNLSPIPQPPAATPLTTPAALIDPATPVSPVSPVSSASSASSIAVVVPIASGALPESPASATTSAEVQISAIESGVESGTSIIQSTTAASRPTEAPTQNAPGVFTGVQTSSNANGGGSRTEPESTVAVAVTAQSEIREPTPTYTADGMQTVIVSGNSSGISSIAPTQTLADGRETSVASTSENSSADTKVGAIVGGVIGGLALAAIIAFLILWYRKKRKDKRDSLLTPLTTAYPTTKSRLYGGINGRRDYTGSRSMWAKAQLNEVQRIVSTKFLSVSDSLRAKLAKDKSTINLNRGNSQFINPAYQHSRTTSAASSGAVLPTSRERIVDWWERLKADMWFNWQLRRPQASRDPFVSTQNMREASHSSPEPDFAAFLAHQRRASQTSSGATTNNLGSLNLDFGNRISSNNPFLKPTMLDQQPTLPDVSSAFAGPVSRSASTSNTPTPSPHISQPPPAVRPRAASALLLPTILESPSSSQHSRSPSTISEASSNRSTLMTSVSSARSKKARSDPFDLSPPNLSYLSEPMPNLSVVTPSERVQRSGSASSSKNPFTRAGTRTSSNGPPSPLPPMGPTSNLLDSLQEFQRTRGSLRRAAQEEARDRSAEISFPISIHARDDSADVVPIASLQPSKPSDASEPLRFDDVLAGSRCVSEARTYSSSNYSLWGDPGPDLGPAAMRRMETGDISPGKVGKAL